MAVFGESSPDALPPWGIWECIYKAEVSCEWEDYTKSPKCEVTPFEEISRDSFRVDLESSPKALSVDEDELPLQYIGPGGGAWTFVNKGTFFDTRLITILSPRGNFRQSALDTLEPKYIYAVGTCTNITPKESENYKPEGGDKKESPARG